eukprot:TRINITY_DN12264_c0_g2_i4.p2 TRINITY_DN12264_c0_g2~~TRINITY_DN12264_c0_g2_i4.p2  ORF type:complete len:214 (-),score=15.48 TRINITY_DN12264_c0_g2_i4:275-916(-)
MIRWVQPKVVVFLFGTGCHTTVKQAVQEMGAVVVSSMEELKSLKIAPPYPHGRNLDITTLCALVSQVTYDNNSQAVKNWGKGNIHWSGCVEKDIEDPMLPFLQQQLFDHPMIVAKSTANSFEELMQKFAGKNERERWQHWKQQINVVDDSLKESRSERIDQLKLGTVQKNVFGLGDRYRYVTLTANTKAVKSAIAQGVRLEVLLHRAVWLTGL